MSHTIHHPAPAAILVPSAESLSARMTSLMAGLTAWRAQARTRTVVAALSPEQLADVAIDPQAVLPSRPVLEVDGGLMAKLMSMR